MANNTNNENIQQYNHVNSDYLGFRNMQDTQEVVQFHDSSLHRIWLNDLPVSYSAHWHSAVEIIVPVENYYDVAAGNVLYHVEPGNIIIIPPGELHELKAPPEGKRFVFLMNISLISRLKGFAGIQALLARPLLITKENYSHIYEDIYEILVQIRNEYFQNSEFAELIIQAKLLELFIKIGENKVNTDELFPAVRPYKQKEYVQKFNQTLEYIDSHYMEDISLESVAFQAGFSKFHFSRLFKQYTDYTFCDYLCYRRIKAAEELLAIPDFSITDVAMQAGFSSISTFNRLFKQQKGCSPSEYRSKNNRYTVKRSAK
ncbi:MAG: AraC family transcriptional regulator [Lachnospiraceae bacterium]|nr:AraC family transcriptional regulator [Lachnospiraceae bacterium]